jgi:hypothetical protein
VKASRLFDDLPALPWVERWQALRNRLSEEIRQPLPDLDALLDGPVVLGILPGDPDRPASFILVEGVRAEARPALEFARALNAVHAAGQDVEVERYLGIPVRRVRVGASQWLSYYVLADRLAVSNDSRVLKRSLDLALSREGVSAADQPLLRKAEADGANGELGAAFDGEMQGRTHGTQPRSGSGREAPLGVRSLSLAGPALVGDLDPELWAPEKVALELSADSGLLLSASGLGLRAAWQRARPRSLPDAQETSLLEDLDRLAASLGRGVVLRLGWESAGRPALALAMRVEAREASQAALTRLLHDALAPGATFEEERLPDNSVLICPRKGRGPPAFCTSLTAETLTFATSRAALVAGRPATTTPRAVPGSDGGTMAVPRLAADLSGTSGHFVGRWSLEP